MLQVKSCEQIPVIAEVDLLVVGGGLSGLAAAEDYAGRGRKVMVIEHWTFLGYEISAWRRPWLRWDDKKKDLLCKWFPVEGKEPENPSAIIPLHLDNLKKKLEDLILAVGVEILYASHVIKCIKKDGQWAVIVGNKSGRQLIRAKSIIDTTENEILSIIMSNTEIDLCTEPEKDAIVRRTIEFADVDIKYDSSYMLQGITGISKGSVELYPGSYGPGHVYVDIPIMIQTAGKRSPLEDTRIEYQARKKSLEVASYLLKDIPAFLGARLCMGSLQVMRRESDLVSLLENGYEIAVELLKRHKFGDDGQIFSCLSSRYVHDRTEVKENTDEKPPLIHWKEDSCTCMMEWREEAFASLGRFDRCEVADKPVPVLRSSDVLVVGGGTSGAPAAFTSGKYGSDTVLLEMNHCLGGAATAGGVNFYWYGRLTGVTLEIDRRVEDYIRQMGFQREACDYAPVEVGWNIEVKAQVLLEMCVEQGVEVIFHSVSIGAIMKGNKVTGVIAATPYGMYALKANVIVDATGDADTAVFAGARYIYGNLRDHYTMWYSLAQFPQPGRTKNNFTSTVNVGDIFDYTRAVLAGRRRGGEVADHGSYIAPRESRHIIGDIVLTVSDQLQMKQYDDVINICFSDYDQKGVSTSELVTFGLHPRIQEVEVPYRALLPVGLEQIVVVGKAISATHDALPSLRMQPDIQNLGAVAGIAASLAIKEDIGLRSIDIRTLQTHLVHLGILSPGILARSVKPESIDWEILINRLNPEDKYIWAKMDIYDKALKPSPIELLCCALASMVVPLLLKAYHKTVGKPRLLLAHLLVWHGREEGLDEVLSEITRMLQENEALPEWSFADRYLDMAPNYGIMPEVLYYLYSLYRIKDKRILPVFQLLTEMICKIERDYTHRRIRIYHYIEGITYVSDRLAFTEFIPLLERLLELAEFQDCIRYSGIQEDIVGERVSYLYLCLSRSLARCGSKKGLKKLAELLEDNRSILSWSAFDELVSITGYDYGLRAASWLKALEGWGESFSPVPWEIEIN